MDRFFLSPESWDVPLVLKGDEAHHCVRVMRKKAGDEIVVFDGKGREGTARILEAAKTEVPLELLSNKESRKPKPEIEIAVGVPKGKSFELILQKAVEMGVSMVHPLMSAQGNVRFDEREAVSKQGKWERVVLEACKQCGQNHLPMVARPLELKKYLADLDQEQNRADTRFVGALLPGVKPFRESLKTVEGSGKIVLVIGPEGDFSPEEYERILASGFSGVGLGDLILRTETAVFWMVSAVRYQFQQ
jgi:16S rRNA (uracil1498-N3)-methyltransferase